MRTGVLVPSVPCNHSEPRCCAPSSQLPNASLKHPVEWLPTWNATYLVSGVNEG